MAELRKINKVEGYKRVLLKFSGFKSIQDAKKEYPGLSNDKIYNQFLENWNELIDTIE